MKLYAISDLHVGFPENRQALEHLPAHPEDWLIVAGDVGERPQQLAFTFEILTRRFARVIWVPGNHELWTLPNASLLRGEARYQELVAQCRQFGVLTPEDPYPVWPNSNPRCVIAPLFLLYDYSFRPPHVSEQQAVAWAMEEGILATDEAVLHPDPYPTRPSWCAARCELSFQRLSEIPSDCVTVLVNHYPLREELARTPAIPRYTIWCGTRRTQDWHTRFRAVAVVAGHLHIRYTAWRDGVRFEEVSLGHPGQWNREKGVEGYLREILPGPPPPSSPEGFELRR